MDDTIIILGAGAVGLMTALVLAERGQTVRLIDRGDPGQETSFGNAGVISPWSFIPQSLPGTWKKVPGMLLGHQRPLGVEPRLWPRMVPWGLRFLRNGSEDRVRAIADAMEPLCAPSVELYRRHLTGTGQEHLVRDSYYVHAYRSESKQLLDALDYRIRSEKGADLDLIGARALQSLEPALSTDFKTAVLIKGQARALSPGLIMQALTEKAKSLGVNILRESVSSLSRNSTGWTVETDTDRHTACKVAVTMGAWSSALLKQLGILVPLMAERGYHVEFPDAGFELNNSILDADAKFVASTMEGGLRAAGHAEFGTVDAPPNKNRQKRLTRQALAAFPDLKPGREKHWMGRRPSFPDSLPMIGAFEKFEGLFAGFGHSHYGLMMAPKTGDLLADMIMGRTPNLDCAPYDTARFTNAI